MAEFDPSKAKMIIISSPSGAGKTSITHAILEKKENFRLSVSVTTRDMRATEIHGKDYFFHSKDEFEEMIANEEFLEYALVYGNMYGTNRKYVYKELDKNHDVLFDIDWQGARSLREHKEFNILSVFILPPSVTVLEERLRSRGLDGDDIIDERMKRAKTEITHYNEYDHVVINEDFESAVDDIMAVIEGRARPRGPENFDEFVKGLIEG